jgi:catechol 2,3-dioxygenase-like lactoylglutathione lyase family enzyme
MATRIKHLAIVSNNFPRLGEFYETLFGMKSSGPQTSANTANVAGRGAVTVSDGYVGLNINGRASGRQAGFDHFGFEVDDVQEIAARLEREYPEIELLKRPSNRPFAGISTHDPAGNVFDLSQVSMENRRGLYAEAGNSGSSHPRRVAHFQVRSVHPERLAEFYTRIYDLEIVDRAADDQNFYLTDGVVTLVIAPWRISNYAGSGIERPAPEHIGFHVESLERFKSDLDEMVERNPALAPAPLGGSAEGDARLKLFETCRYGELHFADPDGVLLDVSEG